MCSCSSFCLLSVASLSAHPLPPPLRLGGVSAPSKVARDLLCFCASALGLSYPPFRACLWKKFFLLKVRGITTREWKGKRERRVQVRAGGCNGRGWRQRLLPAPEAAGTPAGAQPVRRTGLGPAGLERRRLGCRRYFFHAVPSGEGRIGARGRPAVPDNAGDSRPAGGPCADPCGTCQAAEVVSRGSGAWGGE